MTYYFQLLVNDGMHSFTAYSNITIVPVADNDPVINPNGDPIMIENMGPTMIINDIIDNDQLEEHRLIHQINISLYNASANEVSNTMHCVYYKLKLWEFTMIDLA